MTSTGIMLPILVNRCADVQSYARSIVRRNKETRIQGISSNLYFFYYRFIFFNKVHMRIIWKFLLPESRVSFRREYRSLRAIFEYRSTSLWKSFHERRMRKVSIVRKHRRFVDNGSIFRTGNSATRKKQVETVSLPSVRLIYVPGSNSLILKVPTF